MNKAELIFGGVFAAIGVFLAETLGGWDVLLRGLLYLMAFDVITGVVGAFYHKDAASGEFFKGLAKKVGVLVLVATIVVIEGIFKTTLLRGATIGFFISMEVLSILENWGKMGVTIPGSIKATVMSFLRKEGSDNDGKKDD